MEVNLLTPTVVKSKAINDIPRNSVNKVSAEQVKAHIETSAKENVRVLHQNTEAANIQSVNAGLDSPFLSFSLPCANADGMYQIEGVLFSKKEFEQCRSVMQTAADGIQTSGTLDYINYAEMSIAEKAVQSFAQKNLNEEQARVLMKAIQDYNTAMISREKSILSDRAYGFSAEGNISRYYGIRKSYCDTEIKAINDLIDEMNRVSKGSKANVGMDFVSTVDSATNQSLIKEISDLFSDTDLSDTAAVADAMERYKSFMTPVYLAKGLNEEHGALTRVLNRDAENLSQLIDRIAMCEKHNPLEICF